MIIFKVGQYPSLADIMNDEVKGYRKFMSDELASEFHKAIGLAAHGVGVGSFVYLRRVFENLIYNRFEESKEKENWDSDEFNLLRMDDKIKFLKDHIPEYLVQNRKIYSILSSGIHTLTEQECLRYFDILKHSIVMILDDDKKTREAKDQRETLRKAIAAYGSVMPEGSDDAVE